MVAGQADRDRGGFTIARAGNSSPVCGKISHFYLRNRRAFIALNARIGDFLPRCAVAGWYLVCRPGPSGGNILCLADSGLVTQAAAHPRAALRGAADPAGLVPAVAPAAQPRAAPAAASI